MAIATTVASINGSTKTVIYSNHLLEQKFISRIWNYIVMLVAGPNARKDYHYNETEELFYQLEAP
jgi:hypothetical protein